MYRIVLLTEDSAVETTVDRLLTDRIKGRYLMKVVAEPTGALPLINGKTPDVVIGFLPMKGGEFDARMRAMLEYANGIPLIVLLDTPDEATEVRVLQAGAQECLVVPELTARAVARAIRNSVERSRVEEKLAREQEMLGNLLAKLPDRIYFKDLQSRFVRVNQAMADLFRLRDPEMAIGKTDHDFFTAEHAQPALEDERRIIRTGEPIIDKLEKETLPDGSIGWALTSKLPLRDKTGRIIGTFGISHDVTAMKQLEETIEAERRRLEELSEELRAKNIQHEQDLVMAKGIQEALLPGRRYVFEAGPSGARIECSSIYRPAEAVGGDFFTVIPVSETEIGVLICDIMGHGLRAALGTAIMRGLVEQLKAEAAQADQFLTALNRGLRAILRNIDEPLLITACYLVASSVHDEVQLSSAGHPFPLRINRTTASVTTMGTRRSLHGPALALFDDANYGMERFHLAPDEIVLLFTDGATEMSDVHGGEIGLDRFMAFAGRHAKLRTPVLCERMLGDIQLEAGGAAFEDDVCLLAVERVPAGTAQEGEGDVAMQQIG